MHPLVILIPAAALLFGPKLWVRRVVDKHHRKDVSLAGTGAEVARKLLDRHGLRAVRVEITDIGDHYDPETRTIRLTRDKFERKTLTAVTTAAHEVGHALQHANEYGPFVWRTQLAKLSKVTGEVGSVLLLTIPVAAITARQPLPPVIIATTAFTIIGVGVAAQLAALPTELNASFNKALPMLRDGCIDDSQLHHARAILTACSFTYVASSLLGILTIWPWLGRGPVYVGPTTSLPTALAVAGSGPRVRERTRRRVLPRQGKGLPSGRRGGSEALIRLLGKPLLRGWYWCAHNL